MSARRIATSLVSVAAICAGTAVAAAPSASAAGHSGRGTTSLADVLAADGSGFDRNWSDFDIVDNAVQAVLAAKPASPVAVLADGSVPLTAFLPTDRAFRRLTQDITGKWYGSEPAVFGALATAVGIDTVEAVLLYHVVPGATIDSPAALASDNAVLATALPGATFKVDVMQNPRSVAVRLIDADPDDENPFLILSKLDINAGNAQIAHGIYRVLRPVNI